MYRRLSARARHTSAIMGAALTVVGLAICQTSHAQTATPATSTPTAATAAPVKQKLQVTGLVDMYYQYQFADPKHLPQNSLGTPEYNVRNNTPSLSLAELNLAIAPPSTGGSGFKATLIAGDTADLNVGGLGADPTTDKEATYKNIQQLYYTYLSASGWGGDLGKFYTPFGYEVTESNANWNYSRSDIFQYLLPVYHAGLRIYTPSYKGLVATAYLVNSINDTPQEGVYDDNGSKGLIGQLNYTDPKGKWTGVETIGYSADRLPYIASNIAKDDVTLSDTDFTYNINPTNSFGLNYTYRKDEGDSGTTGLAVGGDSDTANGWAVYYRNQFTPKDAVALRYDGFDARTSGIPDENAYAQSAYGTHSSDVKPWEITGTLELKNSSQWLTRLEYRHDGSNTNSFFGSDTTTTTYSGDVESVTVPSLKKSQDMLTIAEVYTFGP